MEKKTVFVAMSNQKGGVGKSALPAACDTMAEYSRDCLLSPESVFVYG